ncbi:gliding motility-associated C-terminal domain-containing protein [Flavobacterium stagni]|uniref:gliding motility-associated C-terminal domain-containing protein n=1 Tax=Flavobacterium stagni TaxID=2506421 RepID=UPI0019D6B59B|nr:gliding motility-associated C-terminal domain-containing protein [Flavobacterium stagni]
MVYQICEILNPTNCDTATVTVTVNAAPIVANDDNGSANGYTGGTAVPNVLVNDTLNGQPVTLAQVNLTQVSTTSPNVTLDPATGAVNVAPGTPAGTYTLVYQICEILNPTNCDTATVTVTVGAAPIIANDDAGTPVNGFAGGTSFTNVLVNDTLNGQPVVAAQVNTTFVSSTNPGVTLVGTDVVVAAGTPAGNYTLVYQICEILNPTNCDTATVTVTVNAAPIVANDDNGSANGYTGGTAVPNVLVNDTLNGQPVTLAQVNLTQVSTTSPNVTLDPATGAVNVAPGTPAGTYTLVYQICEILNPANCDTATVTVTVGAAPIIANDDAGTPVNGFAGGTSFTNVLVNDTLNGQPVLASQVNTTFVSSTNPGVTLVGTDVVVAAGTPAGNYTLVYQICEILNPTNCDTATVTVTVNAAPIVANDDNGSANGYTGGTAVPNVLVNDTLNGQPVTLAQVNLTQVSTTSPNVTLDPATGAVNVAPGTPAGTYTLVYQICEILNPANCDTATVTVTVGAAPIIANDDAGTPVNGFAGGTSFTNVLVNDTLNGQPVLASQVNTTFVSSTNPGVTLVGTDVVVAAGTPAGNYTLVYQICEILNPTNCDTATVTVTVNAAPIVANDDNGSANGYTGGTAVPNVLVNDTLNGQPVTLAQVNLTQVSTTSPNVTLDPATGAVNVAPGTPAGTYTLVYQICEILNPANCDTATVTVTVGAAPIIANDDAGTPVNGFAGGTSFTNVLVNDTLNGQPVLASQVNTTFVSSTNPGVTLVGTDVVVAAGTPAGNYTLVYQICEILNPTNCDTATVTVTVNAATIVANDDTITALCSENGVFANAISNDTLNGIAIANGQVNFTVISGTAPNVVIDSNGNISLSASGSCGTYTFTYQICEVLNPNNCDTATITLTIQDTTAPTFVEATPANVTVECSNVPAAATLTATDNCGTANVTFNEVTAAGNCAGNYTLTRTWTATDACGNTTTATQVVTVQDTTAPTFVEATPANVTVECSNVPAAATMTATDNCGAATVTFNEVTTAGNCASNYTLTRTWTATDACGNTTTATQVVTVQDTTAPTFVEATPANVTVECSNVPAAVTMTATDNCGAANVTFNEVTAAGNCAGNYTLTRTWTATDACGNTTTATQVVTVQDTTAPTFVEATPANVTVECSNVPAAATMTATDNCGAATVTFNEVTAAGNCAGNYTLTRTWTATDACGNTTTATQVVTVQDTTAPSFVEATPANVTVECSNVPAAATMTATDNCGTANVTFNEVTAAGNCASNYTLTRTWTATDACGNTTTATQVVTVQDTTAPTFVEATPANVTVECSNVPAAATMTATDNCGAATVTFNEVTAAGNCAGNYTLTRTWTATDACGNTTTATQVVTVQDTTAPTFVEATPANVTVECSNVPAAATMTATDNCGAATVTFNEVTTAGNCASNYTLTRTWTATDACGNTTTATQVVTVQDTTAPTFVEATPANVTVECSNVPAAATLTATDNCGAANVTFNEVTTAGNCASNYTLTRTWTATDACGNTTTATQVVTVQDTTAPTFVEALPTDVTVECTSIPELVELTATDNCGTATVTFNQTTVAGSCPNNYTLVRTWTGTDECGNTVTHSQNITVQDTTAPTFVETLPTNVTVECSNVPAAATLTASDYCGTATVTFNEATIAGSCPGAYTLTRTWTASDVCGNTTTHVQTITVQDTTAPVFVGTLPTNATAQCDNVPSAATLTATDSCGAATVTFNETSTAGSCPSAYTLTRTWTATDACGNTTTHTQIVNVVDTVAPQIATPYLAVVNVNCDAIPTVPQLQFTDNCSTTVIVAYNETTSPTQNGVYTIVRTWTVSDACNNTNTYTQTVNVTLVAATNNLTYADVVCNNDNTLTVNVANVILAQFPGTDMTSGVWTDVNNTGGLNTSTGVFNPYQIANGSYIIKYTLSNGTCPVEYAVTINVNENACIVLPCQALVINNALTPNGDGANDYFIIENIQDTTCYPENTVEIYNRWGVKVFDTTNYDNESRVFRGVSEGRATVNQSAELPTGTYFYILKYKNAEGNYVTKNGYLYLSR